MTSLLRAFGGNKYVVFFFLFCLSIDLTSRGGCLRRHRLVLKLQI